MKGGNAMSRISGSESYIEVYEKLIAIPDLANTDEEKLDTILRFAVSDISDNVFRLTVIHVLQPDISRELMGVRLEQMKTKNAA
jgi:hypothetical protein